VRGVKNTMDNVHPKNGSTIVTFRK